MSNNELRSLPRDTFEGTKLERVDLSKNKFVAMPSSALSEVSETLRYLNLSHNRIQHLDSTMFSSTVNLLEISLSHNRLTILPDNIFIGLGSLLKLDLSYNPIRANFKELFHYVQQWNKPILIKQALENLPWAVGPLGCVPRGRWGNSRHCNRQTRHPGLFGSIGNKT